MKVKYYTLLVQKETDPQKRTLAIEKLYEFTDMRKFYNLAAERKKNLTSQQLQNILNSMKAIDYENDSDSENSEGQASGVEN